MRLTLLQIPRLLVCAAFASVVLCGFGCSQKVSKPSGTVAGKITYGGKPLDKGSVIFVSDVTGDSAASDLQADGTYTLKYGKGFSVPAGDYRVAVRGVAMSTQPPPDPTELMKNPEKYEVKDPVPDKYRNPASSGLVAVIKEGTNTDVNFDLK